MVGPLVVNVTLSKWFVVRRGWAITIGSMGVSLASLIMPVLMTRVVDAEGWRTGYLVMGIMVWVLVIPVALLMRRMPEDYGLLPDGKREDDEVTEREVAQREATRRDFANSYTRHEALRTRALWMLVVGFGLNMGAVSALLVHVIPFATDGGFTRAEAASGFAAVGLANFSSKFVWGFGLQRFPVRHVAASAFLASASGVGILIVAVDTAARGGLPRVGVRLRRHDPHRRVRVGEVLRAPVPGRGAQRGSAGHDPPGVARADLHGALLRRVRLVRPGVRRAGARVRPWWVADLPLAGASAA